LRLVVPPVPGVKDLPRGYVFGTAMLAAFVTFFAVMALFRPSAVARRPDRVLRFDGAVRIRPGAAAVARLDQAIASRRAGGERFHSVDRAPRARRPGRVIRELAATSGRRGEIQPLHGKLIIRIIGIDLVEVYVSPNRAVTEWVANVVDHALRENTGFTTAPRPWARRAQLCTPDRRSQEDCRAPSHLRSHLCWRC
jgi:hypothetical protein